MQIERRVFSILVYEHIAVFSDRAGEKLYPAGRLLSSVEHALESGYSELILINKCNSIETFEKQIFQLKVNFSLPIVVASEISSVIQGVRLMSNGADRLAVEYFRCDENDLFAELLSFFGGQNIVPVLNATDGKMFELRFRSLDIFSEKSVGEFLESTVNFRTISEWLIWDFSGDQRNQDTVYQFCESHFAKFLYARELDFSAFRPRQIMVDTSYFRAELL